MNGAQTVLRTLADAGVAVCFANPGTSEMHLVAAFDAVPEVRPVLALFEGVVTGMADGYGRMAGTPACTLLHLGPGLANGIANLHNARRAFSPVVNLVGDHATYHGRFDAPLTSDVVGLARPVSGWVHTATSALTVAADTARAVQAAMAVPHQVATLVVPADVAWGEAERPAAPLPLPVPAPPQPDAVRTVARAVRSGARTAVLLGPGALDAASLAHAGRIAEATGAMVLCDTFTPRLARGAGRFAVQRIPYFAEQIVELLAPVEQLVLVGAKPPVAFFAYPGKPSEGLPAAAQVLVLSHAHEDGPAALAALVEELGAGSAGSQPAPWQVDGTPAGSLDQFAVGRIVAALLPEGAVVVDEAATNSLGPAVALATAAPHDQLSLMGGSIGQGLPVATGAAVACPDRKVVCLHGDGGAMYTVQSLWTQAREDLDVTTVVFANRSYAILNVELMRVKAEQVGPAARRMLSLDHPAIDWVQVAGGLGVEAVRVHTVDAFADAFASAMAQRGPRLIEVALA